MSTPARPLAVVVLAAGQGRRLGPTAADRPKWLTDVGDRRIADLQVDALETCLVGATDRVVVVAGHARRELRSWLTERRPTISLEVVENPYYADRNNWFSLLIALRHLDSAGWPGRVAVMNSDLCARPEWYAPFFRDAAQTPLTGLRLAVDFDRPLVPESMKVSTHLEDGLALCTAIGKVGVLDPHGEYVGLAVLDADGCRARLRTVLEGFEGDQRRYDAWYEAGFQVLMDEGIPVSAWATPDSQWVEIDDENDLSQARAMMSAGP
jgi:choline kinase